MKSDSGQLSQPLLLQQQQASQYEKERDSVLQQLRDGKQGLLAAAAAHEGLSYGRTRSLQLKKTTIGTTIGTRMPQQQQREDGSQRSWLHWPAELQLNRLGSVDLPLALPLKAGFAALIASLLAFAPGFLRFFNNNSAWSVVTVDIVMESNVGLTFSKGLNRTVGTLLAALLALLVGVLGKLMGPYYERYLLGLCTFLGAAIPTYFKFRRPFSDRWNYAVVMAMVTFHLLILSPSDAKLKLPLLRLALIVVGFVIAALVNVLLLPNFAGSNTNNLLARNFIRAGNVIEKCVVEFCRGTVLECLPEARNHAANNDGLHSCFHEIMSTDSEVDKLLAAARCEPPHGKFFLGYPWHLYHDLAEELRLALYDIVALDNCLRAEIQSPIQLRTMFSTELLALGKEIAGVFRALGSSMLKMEKLGIHKVLDRADEVALLLQHKIAKQSDLLLQLTPRQDHIQDSEPEQKDGTESIHPERHLQTPEGYGAIVDRAKSLERMESIAHHWECTVRRLAALSLIKFASLLIEVAAKLKHVVGIADELAEKALFDEPASLEEPSDEFVSAFTTI